jgi:putative transposase
MARSTSATPGRALGRKKIAPERALQRVNSRGARREVAIPSTTMKVSVPIRSRIKAGVVYELQEERLMVVKIEGLQAIGRLVGTEVDKVYALSFLEEQAFEPEVGINLRKVSARRWNRAKRVKTLCVQIIHERIKGREKLDALGKPLGLKWRQLQRWVRKYRASPRVSSCLQAPRGRTRGVHVLCMRIDTVIRETAKAEIEDKAEETSLDVIVDEIKRKCDALGLKPPGRFTVWKRLKEWGYSLGKRRAYGPAKYKESIAILEGSHKKGGWPGKEFQIDHTQADIMVLDESRQLCLGRPWLTLVVDTYSGCVCGLYFSFRPPSIHSVARALTVAVSNKASLLQRLNLSDLHWEMQGMPLEIFTDRAAEFRCDAFIRGCDEYNIKPRLRPKDKKHWGGRIERLIGTFMGRLHLLLGTTFSNVPRRIRYDPAVTAAYTGRELLARLVAHVCEYHDTPKRSEGNLTPSQLWTQGQSLIPPDSGALRIAPMPAFYRDFLPQVTSKRQRSGIQWGDYHFRLGQLRSIPVGHDVTYLPDTLNTDTIKLLLPHGEYLEIPRDDAVTYNNHELQSQLRAAQRHAAQVGLIAERRETAKRRGKEIEDEARRLRDEARRRAFDLPPPPPMLPASPPAPSEPRTVVPHVGSYVPPATILVPRRMR